jgi:Virulence-associated protein E
VVDHALDEPAPGSAPDGMATAVDAIVSRAVENPEAVLSDDLVAAVADLNALDVARLKLRLAAEKVRGVGDLLRAARKLSKTRIAERATSGNWRDDLRCDSTTGRIRPSLGNVLLLLEQKYAERLTFDEMAHVACLDDTPVDDAAITDIRRDLERDEDAEWSRENVTEALQRIARSRSFHPVKRYLRSVAWDGEPRLDRIAAEYFGATDELSSVLISRTLIAAVARAMDPGCKVDTVCILVGDEGKKKSTFWGILGGAWFCDSDVDIQDRKGIMVMHSAWIYEWPEIDRMLERKHDSEVKAFVSQQRDRFIPPYGRSPVDLRRSNIVVGTTNKEKFITSDTGSRRWHVVTVRKMIDHMRLRAERDQLWAEAVVRYDAFVSAEQNVQTAGDANPDRWWLTQAEDSERAEQNEEHLTESTTSETVDAWLRGAPIACPTCQGRVRGRGLGGAADTCPQCLGERRVTRGPLPTDPRTGREYVTLALILGEALGVPLERHSAHERRVANVLRRLKWRSGKAIRPNGAKGSRVTPYYSPDANPDADEREAIMEEPPATQPPPDLDVSPAEQS